jgi:hypothetical protein
MGRVQSWMMWVAGMLAILGSLHIARLPLALVFIQIDVLMPIVGLLCFAVAYVSREELGRNSVLNYALWITGIAAFASIVPLVSLPIVLPFITLNALTLMIGFACLIIAYLKTWRR